jgi:hypothetical protein
MLRDGGGAEERVIEPDTCISIAALKGQFGQSHWKDCKKTNNLLCFHNEAQVRIIPEEPKNLKQR